MEKKSAGEKTVKKKIKGKKREKGIFDIKWLKNIREDHTIWLILGILPLLWLFLLGLQSAYLLIYSIGAVMGFYGIRGWLNSKNSWVKGTLYFIVGYIGLVVAATILLAVIIALYFPGMSTCSI